MWIIEVFDGAKPVQEFFFKGPVCEIGRNVDANHLSFSEDKSISRKHAELHLVTSAQDALSMKVFVKDLGSKFGTHLNDQKIEPNTLIEVPNRGSIIKVGAAGLYFRVAKHTLSVCPTRLDKLEKTRLKTLTKLIQARIVTKAESATHVISNKITATVKSLTAIVLKLKTVTMDWLSFAETNNAIELIPPIERYTPPISEEIEIKQIDQPRKSLFADMHVVVLNETDDQYSYLMNACGASVVSVFAELMQGKHAQIASLVTASLGTNTHKRVCLFFDENRGMEPEVEVQQMLRGLDTYWLTAASLAASIMELSAPAVARDPPTKIRMTGYSQSQRVGARDSQFFGPTSQPPLIQSTVVVSAAQVESAAAKSSTPFKRKFDQVERGAAEDAQFKAPPPRVASPPPTTVPAVKEEKEKEKIETPAPSSSAGKERERERERKRQTESAPHSFLNELNELWSTAPVDPAAVAPSSSVKKSSSAQAFADSLCMGRKRRADEFRNDAKDDSEDDVFQRIKTARAQQMPLLLPIKTESAKVEPPQRVAASASSSSSKPVSASTAVESRPRPRVDVKSDADDGGGGDEWMCVVRGLHRMDILAQKSQQLQLSAPRHEGTPRQASALEKEIKGFVDSNPSASSESNDVEVMEKPITVERDLLSAKASSSSSSSSSSSACAESTPSGLRNVKCFRKNAIKCARNVVRAAEMDRVLPKESEREIQLRLEFEASRNRDDATNLMFAEQSSKKTTTRKR